MLCSRLCVQQREALCVKSREPLTLGDDGTWFVSELIGFLDTVSPIQGREFRFCFNGTSQKEWSNLQSSSTQGGQTALWTAGY